MTALWPLDLLLAWFTPGFDATIALATLVLAVCGVSGAALLGARASRRHHAARYAVLSSALACNLLMPAVAVLYGSTGASLIALPWLPPATARPARPSELAGRATPFVERWEKHAGRDPEPPRRAEGPVAAADVRRIGTVSPERPHWQTAASIGIAIWIIGAFVGLALIARDFRRLRRVAREAAPPPPGRLGSLPEQVAQALGTRAPRVLSSCRVQVPQACGVFRPAVILPEQLIPRLTAEQLRDVLLHETAHLLRRDPLALLLQRVGGALYWPIPLVPLLNRQLSRAREEICDNHVLAHRDPVRYGETLLQIAQLVCHTRPQAGAVGILVRRGTLEQRIANLIEPRRNTMTRTNRWPARISLLAYLAFGVCCCGVSLVAAPSETLLEGANASPRDADQTPAAATEQPKEESPPGDDTPKAQRIVFKPKPGMEHKSSWTALSLMKLGDEDPHERLFGRLTLGGEIPVKRARDEQPIFTVKLKSGNDAALNVKLTRPGGEAYDRVLRRDRPLKWKIGGQIYRITYPSTHIGPDKPAESPYATLIVNCKPNEAGDTETAPPEETTDEDADVRDTAESPSGANQADRDPRAATAPLLRDLAEQHGYGLGNEQVLRHIPPPFPELRSVYHRTANPRDDDIEDVTSMIFDWIDNRLHIRFESYSGPPEEGLSLLSLIRGLVFDLDSQHIEDQDDLLTQKVAGDWVLRAASPDRVIAALERILREELAMPIRMELRTVERSVYVARGSYKFTPLETWPGGREPEDDQNVHVFGGIASLTRGGGGFGVDGLFEAAGSKIDTPIVNRLDEPPPRDFQYQIHRPFDTEKESRSPEQEVEFVLETISRQTGFEFSKETRPVQFLFVTKSALAG